MAVFLLNGTGYLTNTTINFPEPQSYTVSMWFSLPAIGTPAAYRSFFSILGNSIALTTDNTGSYIDFGSATIDVVYNTNGTLIANKWYHVAYVIQANSASSHNIYGYLNGQLVATGTDTSTYATATSISIGSYSGTGTGPLNGSIRDLKFWRRTLLASEVIDEMNSTVPVHKAGLVAYYPFDSSTTADLSGNGKNLTSNGTVSLQGGNYHESWLGRGVNYIR